MYCIPRSSYDAHLIAILHPHPTSSSSSSRIPVLPPWIPPSSHKGNMSLPESTSPDTPHARAFPSLSTPITPPATMPSLPFNPPIHPTHQHHQQQHTLRKKLRLSPFQKHLLQTSLATDPFPTKQQRCVLAQQTGLTPRQIQVWFQNKRQRTGLTGVLKGGQRGERREGMSACPSPAMASSCSSLVASTHPSPELSQAKHAFI